MLPFQAVYMKFPLIDVDLVSDDCPRDALLIYNGAVAEGEAEKRLCGQWEDWQWITRYHNAILQLISDDSNAYQGFYLNFQSIVKFSIQSMYSKDLLAFTIKIQSQRHTLNCTQIKSKYELRDMHASLVYLKYDSPFKFHILNVFLGIKLWQKPLYILASQGSLECGNPRDAPVTCTRNWWWIRVNTGKVVFYYEFW